MTGLSVKQEKSGGTLDAVFHPTSVAVVGASSDSEKERHQGWLGRLLRAGYQGKIYPINPNAEEILGMKAYPSIASVPEPIDYAILSVPTRAVPKVVEECIAKGVKAVHSYTAGFAETGTEEGRKLQEEVGRLIKGSKTRLIGPNCLGIYCPESGLAMDGRFPKESGPIGLVCQTGTGLIQLVLEATARGLRFSKAVSFGNAVDLDAPDFLEYYAADEGTRIILVYVEGVKDGERFFRALRECNRVKPVVLLKGGMSESGAGVASSHTGSLAGSRQVWQTLFKQTGVIPVQTFDEAIEQMVSLVYMAPPRGRRVGIVGRGGGAGVITTDICEREGLVVPPFSPETRAALSKMTPPGGGSMLRNPVEIGLGKFGISEHYVPALKVVDADPDIDLILTYLDPEQYVEHIREDWVDGARQSFLEAAKQVTKPLVVVLKPGSSAKVFEWIGRLQLACKEAGIPAYRNVETAIRAVGKMIGYHEFKSRVESDDGETEITFRRDIADRARAEGRGLLTEVESKELLKSAGVPVVDTRLATSREEAVSIAGQIGFPLALKVVSPQITHKTDAGGVQLNLQTAEQVGQAYDDIVASAKQFDPQAVIQGVSVQKMAPAGIEVIMGMNRDPQFGPVLMFGLGGILVEILKDVSFRICPLTKQDAREMVREIKGHPLLTGYRGQAAVDVAKIEEMLLKLSAFVEKAPDIQELDLNPVFAYADDVIAVDARVVLRPEPAS